MKKNILISIAAILLIVAFVSWQKPPVEYVTIVNYNMKVSYWSNEYQKRVECGSIQEAMNTLSYFGYKFQGISSGIATASNQGVTSLETIIMAK